MTETNVCNLALGRLGETRVMDLSESTAAARACALWYSTCRRESLRMHDWNFATDRATLTELVTPPLHGWGHQFELPANCLKVVALNASDEGDVTTDPYVIEGRKLLTDADTADIVYIFDETNPDNWDTLFLTLVTTSLAVKLSESLRGSTGKTTELLAELSAIEIPKAQRTDANESRGNRGRTAQLAQNSAFVSARFWVSN